MFSPGSQNRGGPPPPRRPTANGGRGGGFWVLAVGGRRSNKQPATRGGGGFVAGSPPGGKAATPRRKLPAAARTAPPPASTPPGVVVTRGILATASLGLSGLLGSEAGAIPRQSRRPSVIILWMRGGPSHIDMWDPKPDAPAEYRGEFGVMRTNVPGILLSDMLPMCGRIMDRWSIVRSLNHQDAGHSTGDQICFTGYPPGP